MPFLEHDIFECRVEGSTPNLTRWNNVFHFQLQADSSEDLFDFTLDLAQLVYTQYVASFTASMQIDYLIESCRAAAIYPQSGPPAVFINATPTPGDDTGAALPPDVAAVITKRTNQPGRTFLGRMYLTGLPASIVTNDTIDQAAAQTLASAAETLLADDLTLTGGDVLKPVVFSRKLADQLVTAENAAADIQSVEVDRVTRNLTGRGIPYRIPVIGQE